MTNNQSSGYDIDKINASVASQSEPSEKHTGLDPDKHCSQRFRTIWPEITSDNYLSLFGFQRYRTAHLLNLRFLEAELGAIDRDIYQSGLQLSQPLDCGHVLDRLGLKHAKKDNDPKKIEEVVNQALIIRLRELIKQYGKYTPYKFQGLAN